MPTVQLKATKMSDAKVSFISLVERGANRIPFKIVKQEKGMAGNSAFAGLDLSNLFTRKSEKETTQTEKVEVVGVVTMKGDSFDSVKAQLEAQGVKVSDATEMEDGSVVFKQVDGDVDGEGLVVRVNEHVAFITKGFRPYNMDMAVGEQSFEAVCKSQGFYPGVSTVMNVLGSSVVGLVEKADDPAKAAAAVSSMFEEAKQYVTKMVSALPAVAFKAESVMPEVVEKAAKEMIKCKTCGTECEAGCEKCPKCGSDPMAEPKAKKEDEACAECGTPKSEHPAIKEEGEDVCKACGSKKKKPADARNDEEGDSAKKEEVSKSEKSLTTEEVSAIVSTQVETAMETLTKKMEEMISGLTSQVTKSVQEVSDKVTQVESVAKSASDKVAGIVVSGSDADDHDKVQKTECVGFGGREIDTAFMPKIRKQASR